MTTTSNLKHTQLFSDAANERVNTLGQRRWGGGSATMPIKYTFEGGFPDPSTFPMEALSDVTRRVLMTDRTALNYDFVGYGGMRKVVIELERPHGGNAPKDENILITAGASQALQLVYSAFINPDDTVLLEESSYIAQQIRMWKPNVTVVPMDDDGACVDELRQTLESLASKNITPKFFYVVADFNNPLGMSYSLERRKQILDLAYEFGFMIVEDDPYGRIRFKGEYVPSFYSLDSTGQHVIRLGTVSKILGAGMRIGWAIAAPDVLNALRQFKQDGGTNPFAQRVTAEFLKDNLWSHIKVVTESYHRKRDWMLDAMTRHCGDLSSWNVPDGGIFLWVRTHDDVDDAKMLQRALEEGVAYRPGFAFSSNGGGKKFLRLAYSFQDQDSIEEGIKRLGRAMHSAAD